MRIGKSGAVTCDFCGLVVVGGIDRLILDDKEMHFCRTEGCYDQYVLETFVRDRVEDALELRVKEEFKVMHDQVCPACRFRLLKLL